MKVTERTFARVTPEEKQQIVALAEVLGITESRLVRKAINDFTRRALLGDTDTEKDCPVRTAYPQLYGIPKTDN